jgi:hypothetical protein
MSKITKDSLADALTGRALSVIVFLIIFVQLNQRPAILQAAGEVMFALSVGLIGLLFMLGYRLKMTQRQSVFLVIAWTATAYLCFQVLVTIKGMTLAVLVNSLFVFAAGLTVVILRPEVWGDALKAIVYPTLALSLSYFITFLLVVGLQVPIENLELTSFTLAQAGVADRYLIMIFFPISPALGLGGAEIFGIPLARAVGYFREPGIFQVIVVTSYFGLNYLEIRFRGFWKLCLLTSLFLTYSTAGVGAFIASYVYFHVIARQPVGSSLQAWARRFGSALLLLPLGYWFLLGESKFALLEKLSHGSGAVRVETALEGLEALQSNPLLGVGYRNPEISGLTFTSVAGQIGGIGVFLFLGAWVIPNFDFIRRFDRRLVLLVPVVLTTLLAQPLFDKPMYLLLVALVTSAPRTRERAAAPRHLTGTGTASEEADETDARA